MKFLLFVNKTIPKRKTPIIMIYSILSGNYLGKISYYSQWRKYVFHPDDQTVWDDECLKEIIEKISELNRGDLQ